MKRAFVFWWYSVLLGTRLIVLGLLAILGLPKLVAFVALPRNKNRAPYTTLAALDAFPEDFLAAHTAITEQFNRTLVKVRDFYKQQAATETKKS